MEQIAVLGGGAAGIVAAITAAKYAPKGVSVVLLEQNPRVGKKLLATGNGRCNLSNQNISPAHYVSADPKAVEQMLTTIEKIDPLCVFSDWGLLTRTDSEGRVYPYSNQASDFLNLLLYRLQQSGVTVKTDCKVKTLAQKGKDYCIVTDEGERIYAKAVIAAFGGKAGPQFGTDGFGSKFAQQAGLQLQKEYPCLVALKCQKQQIAGLSGIRVKAAASLYDADRCLAQEEGEIQFTEAGISGIAVMQLSNRMRGKGEYRITLDLFPQFEKGEVESLLWQRVKLFADAPIAECMTGLLHKRIANAVCKAAGITDLNRLTRTLSKTELAAVAEKLTQWEFTALSPLDYKAAQVTGGGIALSQIDPQSFQVYGIPGFYAVGEMLDCTGDCGGFNLHFAFGSGMAAGIHAAKYCSRRK